MPVTDEAPEMGFHAKQEQLANQKKDEKRIAALKRLGNAFKKDVTATKEDVSEEQILQQILTASRNLVREPPQRTPSKPFGLQETDKVISLAKAGLYYLPDAKIEDRTVCYACGKALHTWAPTDDPLYEHCQVNPDCSHIQVRLALAPALLQELLRQLYASVGDCGVRVAHASALAPVRARAGAVLAWWPRYFPRAPAQDSQGRGATALLLCRHAARACRRRGSDGRAR